ncbi:TPR-like protein [Wolfiporia cocos MD-104 SS10]|uniref:TPR-like protein n=1 Tax=Wolfiporia cocos (strain MD-104) TaxID=742152 RepID=A0A2H3JFH4_WOLCO|nr:TPR-like protein [Wolfiporia cocos MD-104 SS10]
MLSYEIFQELVALLLDMPRRPAAASCSNCGRSDFSTQESNFTRRLCFSCRGTGHATTACPQYPSFGRIGHRGSGPWSRPNADQGSLSICQLCGVQGHTAGECTNSSRWKCVKCGQTGHIAAACPNRLCSDEDLGSAPSQHYTGSQQTDDGFHPGPHQNAPRDSYSSQEAGSTDAETSQPKNKRGQPNPNALIMDLLSRAKAMCASENYTDAISLLTEAISIEPAVAELYASRGIAHANLKNYTNALGDFQSAMIKDESTITSEILIWISRCRLHLGSHSTALLAVRDALAMDPQNEDGHTLMKRIRELGNHQDVYKTACSRNQWRTARTAYESCLSVYVEEDGDFPIELRCWGITLRVAEGDWDKAMEAIDHLMIRNPKNIQLMVIRSQVLFLTARLSQAFTQISAAAKLDPDDKQAQALRVRVKGIIRFKEEGDDHHRQGRSSSALDCWNSALELIGEKEEESNGGLIRALFLQLRATTRLQLEQYLEGVKDINTALGLEPASARAYAIRGRLNAGLELYETAVEDFARALEFGGESLDEQEMLDFEAERDDLEKKAQDERAKEKDYYQILGLSHKCTTAEIRKAYRTYSLKYHPDKGGIAEKFNLVSEAYSILSNITSRRDYDIKLKRSTRSTRKRNSQNRKQSSNA